MHEEIQYRCEKVQRIRNLHEKIKKVIYWVVYREKQQKNIDDVFIAALNINHCYQVFDDLDILDLTK
jgi:hypothetical protein